MNRILILLLISLITFSNSLQNDFALDDLFHIKDNPAIRTFSPVELFKSPVYPGNLYRPLPMVSYAATYQMAGLNPWPYHLTNLLIHCLVVLLSFHLLQKLFDGEFAFLTALLFAVHPLHIEAVANVSGRPELLAALFGICAVLSALRYIENEKRYGALSSVFISTLLALFSKESGLVLPGLIVLSSVSKSKNLQGIKGSVRPVLASLLAVAIYFWFRTAALGAILPGTSPVPPIDNPLMLIPPGAERTVNALRLLGRYVRLILIPSPLSADYSYAAITPISWPPDSRAISDLAALLLLVLVMIYGAIKREPRVLFNSLWFLVSFAVTCNIFLPIGTAFAERLAYLPSLGGIGLIAFGILRFSSAPVRRTVTYLLSASLALNSYAGNFRWRDNFQLFGYEVSLNTRSARSLFNFGIALRQQGDLNSALSYLQQSFSIYPFDPETPYAIGVTDKMLNNLERAESWFKKSLEIDPNHVTTLLQLGTLEVNQAAPLPAEKHFLRALALQPNNVQGMLGLFAAKILLGDVSGAATISEKLQLVAPDDPQYLKLKAKFEELSRSRE